MLGISMGVAVINDAEALLHNDNCKPSSDPQAKTLRLPVLEVNTCVSAGTTVAVIVEETP